MSKVSIEKVESLLLALKSGDEESSQSILDEITQDLHTTMVGFGDDAELLFQAKHDIPEVSESLEYVIQTTKEASNEALSASENAIALLENMQDKLGNNNLVSQEIADIKSQLTAIMMSQSFQDLTGQVLNRVIFLVANLEVSLIDLIEKSGINYDKIPNRPLSDMDKNNAEMQGIGPNVTRSSQKDSITSQSDIDDLLGDLGI